MIVALLLQPLPATAAAPAQGLESEMSSAAPALDDRLTVANVRGRVFHIKEKGTYLSLARGAAIDANRPVRVGPRSRADLELRSGGLLELGPDAQVVLLAPRRDGGEEANVTTLRLDRGYLRVRLKDPPQDARFAVSFGRWSAELKPGEYVFDTADGESSACLISGGIRISGGAPESIAPLEPGQCLRTAGDAPTWVTLSADDRDAVGRRRALLPLLAEANRRERDDALGQLEARYVANPGSGESETSAAPTAENQEPADAQMPRAGATRRVAARPISTTHLESQIRTLDRRIEHQQAELAEALVASVKVPTVPAATPTPVSDAPLPPAESTTAAPSSEVQLSYARLASPANAPGALTPVSIAPPGPPAEGEPQAPARSAPSSEWIVNVATHPTLESAEAQAEQLRAQKLSTGIRRETVRGRSSYRVVIEGLASEQAANALAQMLVSEQGLRQAWVFRKR